MRKKTNFAPLKSSLHRPTGPWKSPQPEFVEACNCHCCCRLLHRNPMAVYRLLLSWANAEVSSQGVVTKWQNSTSFGSAKTKNNKCTTKQPSLGEYDEICYMDPILKDRQWSAYIDRSPGVASYSEECFHACVTGCGYKYEISSEKVDEVHPNRPTKPPPEKKPPPPPTVKASCLLNPV
ncbi:hypothetical protein ACSBR1_022713 [Camellia fascicularis]